MNARLLALAILPAVALALPPADPAEKGKNYKTPQEVYDAWVKARKAGDVKAALACLTPEALREAAAADAISVVGLKNVTGPGVAEMRKASGAVMEKHGVTEKVTEGIKDTFFNRHGTPKEREKLGKVIKDPRAFILELAEAQEKALKDVKGGITKKGFKEPKVTLADLKIDGDKATGVILRAWPPARRIKDDPEALAVREQRQKISFVKGGMGWRIIPSYENPTEKLVPVKDKGGKDK